jgi:glutamate N-acetyltransferase/amino-acid N-acetyltransferase
MIHPKMATMLAFVTSDAKINAALLSRTVKRVVDRTFNNLTVDGDTSTNDMVLVLANGMSGVSIESPAQLARFEGALFTVCNTLCRKIAEDGEGATKRVEVTVSGGKTYSDAKAAAKAVANSNLVKTALFGNDPNWGRILCAIGYSGADFSKEKLTVKLCGTLVCKNLRPVPFAAQKLREKLSRKVVAIEVDLGLGNHCAIAHTCDLTYDYIKINAEYHT